MNHCDRGIFMETVEVTTFIDEQAIRWKVAGDLELRLAVDSQNYPKRG